PREELPALVLRLHGGKLARAREDDVAPLAGRYVLERLDAVRSREAPGVDPRALEGAAAFLPARPIAARALGDEARRIRVPAGKQDDPLVRNAERRERLGGAGEGRAREPGAFVDDEEERVVRRGAQAL